MRRAKIVVVGGGALGLACGVGLARGGAEVHVYDPAPRSSASAVAAGMLAPYSEWLLDPVAHDHLALLAAAADRWPAFAARHGVPLDEGGTLHLAAPDVLEHRRSLLRDHGVASQKLSTAEAAMRAPGLQTDGALWLDERRLQSHAAMRALEQALGEAGGVLHRSPVAWDAGVWTAGGATISADLVVLAPGAGAWALAAGAPELAGLHPIKGQLLSLHTAAFSGPSVRVDGAYLVPQAKGVLVGATMVEGRDDLEVDRDAAIALRRTAQIAVPALADAPGDDRVGVRMAARDGLPLVGPSSRPGVLLAVGARRNGWLLAPLVAEMIAAYAAGRDPGPFAAALSPARFTSQDPA